MVWSSSWGTDEAQIESVYGDIRNDVAGQQVPDGQGGMRPMTQEEMEAERTALATVRDKQTRQEELLRGERRRIGRHGQATMELEKKRDSLRQRSEHVDRSRAALLKLRDGDRILRHRGGVAIVDLR